jgi:hypothetical protein
MSTATIEASALGLIAEAYEDLAPAPGEFVSIRALREALGGRVPNLDRALVGMYREGLINLTPAEDQMRLDPADRAAGIPCGGEIKHRLSWED